MSGHLPRIVLFTLITLLLAACGGGSGGGGATTAPGAGDGGTGGGTTGTPVLTLSVLDANGAATNNVTGTNVLTLRAVLVDGNGDAIVGEVVNFTSDVGQISPATGNTLTIAGGIAELNLGAGTVADAGQVRATATVNGEQINSNTIGLQSDGLGSGGTSNTLTVTLSLATTDNSITLARNNPGVVTVRVIDALGADVANAVVQFTTSRGVLDPESGAVSTNASGIATINISAGTESGAGVLNAKVTFGSDSVDADPVNFISDGDAVATISLSISSGSQNTVVTNAAPQTVTATVVDNAGALVQGAIVTFVKGGNGGLLSRNSDVTNALGQATTNILAGTVAQPGEISATASVGGSSISTTKITFSSAGDGPFDGTGSSNLSITIALLNGAGQPLVGAIQANSPGILQATVLDANGAPSAGLVIEFNSGGTGDLFPVSGLSLTNALGIASVALNAGSQPGAAQATATIVIDDGKFNSDTLTFETLGNAGDTPIVLTLNLTDATPGNGTNIISSQDNASVSILVEDDTGTNLANRTASITSSQGTTVAVAGGTAAATITAVSDADGRINVTLSAGTSFGAGDLIVTVGDTSQSVQFEVGVAGLRIGTCSGGTTVLSCGAGTTFTAGGLDIATSPLSAGGTSSVSLVVTDATGAVVPNIDIGFASTCTGQVADGTTDPLASISQTVTSNASGVVSATYQASGCVGDDIVTATESSTGETASGSIDVLPPTIGSIVFDAVNNSSGAAISNIFIQESGGESTARVVFQVLDVFGNPARDEDVSFALTSNVGGIALQNSTGLTDANGKATAFVNSGFIATTVRVRASIEVDTDNNSIDDTTLVTLSSSLSINTGIADQNSFSLSSTSSNFEGFGIDGITETYSVRLADRFNNPVPDGTSVQFRTELGRIDSSCTTQNGDCDVILNSQAPRGPLDPNTVVRNLAQHQCPSALVSEENITISGTSGKTQYVIVNVLRLETIANVSETNFTTDSDGEGITCNGGACLDGATLKITYNRAFLDEDSNGTVAHVITNPGQATAPFRPLSERPCDFDVQAQGGSLSSGYPGGLGQINGARSTILAFAQGEESFVDANSNGLYDFNEVFVDLTEVFHDYNEDGVYGNGTVGTDDSRDVTSRSCYGPAAPINNGSSSFGNCYQVGGDEEEFVDFGVAATLNNKFDAGNGIYNGTLCPKAISDRADTCDNIASSDPCDEATERYCTRELVNVSRSAVMLFSASNAQFSLIDGTSGERISKVDLSTVAAGRVDADAVVVTNAGANIAIGADFKIGHGDDEVAPQIGDSVILIGGGGVTVLISDEFNNRLPAGTTISVAAGSNGCLISNSPGAVVANSIEPSLDSVFISLTADATKANGSDVITVTVTTPQNVKEEFVFNCAF